MADPVLPELEFSALQQFARRLIPVSLSETEHALALARFEIDAAVTLQCTQPAPPLCGAIGRYPWPYLETLDRRRNAIYLHVGHNAVAPKSGWREQS